MFRARVELVNNVFVLINYRNELLIMLTAGLKVFEAKLREINEVNPAVNEASYKEHGQCVRLIKDQLIKLKKCESAIKKTNDNALFAGKVNKLNDESLDYIRRADFNVIHYKHIMDPLIVVSQTVVNQCYGIKARFSELPSEAAESKPCVVPSPSASLR